MLGFSLQISELKALPTRRFLRSLESTDSRARPELIRGELQGESISDIFQVTPWWCVGRLLELVEDYQSGGALMLHRGGFPFLFTARGGNILRTIAEVDGSRHRDLLELLEGDTMYFLEAWDQG